MPFLLSTPTIIRILMIHTKIDKRVLYFVLKFLLYFILFYGLSYIVIALATTPGYYSSYVANHLDYVSGLRKVLLEAAYLILNGIGYVCSASNYTLQINGGAGVHINISCIGIGLISFWWAFILAFPRAIFQKVVFFVFGTIAILFLNVVRIAGLAIVYTKFGRFHIDHHLIFNILAYLLVLAMIIWVINYRENVSRT